MSADFITYYTKNKKTVTVREVTILDAERMLLAGTKALKDAPYMLSTAEELQKLTVEDMKKLLKTYDQNQNNVQFVAEVDGELVGAIEFKSGDKEKISHQGSFAMTVLPEFRNYGIGRALLATLINWAKNNSRVEKVCLEVMEGNLGAINLYKTMGFVEEGRKIKGVKLEDCYQDLILMAIFV
ncbi:GNAT family N-acetyltransferase [Bacillus sp. ISL-39]|nr:GNAT family N-acetyltransferase [Bacillus sp. ISL-39]